MEEVSLRYITVVLCVDLYFSPDNCLNPFNQHIYSIGAEKCWEGLRSAGLRHYFWIGGAGAGAAVVILCERIYHSLLSAHLSLNQTVWCLLEQFCWPDRGCSFFFFVAQEVLIKVLLCICFVANFVANFSSDVFIPKTSKLAVTAHETPQTNTTAAIFGDE